MTIECSYKAPNGKSSILAEQLLNSTMDSILTDKIMNYIYSDNFEVKYGDWKRSVEMNQFPVPLDVNGEPSIEWVEKNILPTYESNKSIEEIIAKMEKSGELVIDCSEGRIKARHGLQVGFTTGGEWKFLKEFKGASHKKGGIDIEIGNSNISINRNKKEFKAKHGLVVPNGNFVKSV